MPSIADVAPLCERPRRFRALLLGHALAVAALAALTAATASVGTQQWFDAVYDLVLPAILFGSPVVVGVVSAALGGGLVPTLALGAAPSLVWAVAVVVGRGLGSLLGRSLPIPDSPLWAITGAFLVIGLAGALSGFVAGRLGRLVWRRFVG